MHLKLAALTLFFAACASAPEPTAVDPEAERFEEARRAVVDLRAQVARMNARVGVLRQAIQDRDPLADWGQLVCLEGRMPSLNGFVQRGERAYDNYREAFIASDRDRAQTRLAQIRLAEEGLKRQLALARSCASAAALSVPFEPEG